MPVRSGSTTTDTTGGTGVITPPAPPSEGSWGPGVMPNWHEDVGTMRATWTAPNGVVYQLSDDGDTTGWFTRPEISGWGATTYEIVTEPDPRGGDQVREIRSQPGRLQWPLHVFGDTHLEFLARHRTIKRAFTMTAHRKKPGILRVARPDGSAREVECFYEEGFGGESGEGWLSANPVIQLFCPDGYWRDIEPKLEQRKYSETSNFFLPFPTISPSNVLGNTTITNAGDVDAWPTWTIYGPCTQLAATNLTTGKAFTFDVTLGAGETATITTNRPTVRGPAGENLIEQLNWPTCQLWGLVPDDNLVSFVVGGAGPGSKVELLYYPRYEGA